MSTGGNQLSKRTRYTPAETAVFVAAGSPGTREHLNATLLPNNPAAKTTWGYLTTNGSNDGAPYLKATP